jgi:hypothetical protein
MIILIVGVMVYASVIFLVVRSIRQRPADSKPSIPLRRTIRVARKPVTDSGPGNPGCIREQQQSWTALDDLQLARLLRDAATGH